MSSPALAEPTKRRGIVRYETNPFTRDLTIKTRTKALTVATSSAILVDKKDGTEKAGEVRYAQLQEVDETQFVKIFGLTLGLWMELNKPGSDMFIILLRAIQKRPMKDAVYMDAQTAKMLSAEITGKPLSDATFFRGMAELRKKEVIADSVHQNLVFINPAVAFNGDRARFMLELRKKSPAPIDEAKGHLQAEADEG